jgi:cation transport regulator ChaC
VTLVAEPGAHCHGRAFLVEPEVFEHLDHREKNGYQRNLVSIRFDSGSVDGVVSNRDYVLELARALRRMGFSDEHVFELESCVLAG